ncbi:hypothetical protein S83_020309, partial [Arachis hypogaea]
GFVTHKKRRLADMLGLQWSKEELEHFYKAYRKYGKDWKKAYLSLLEGTTSVIRLIAMMTNHYSVLGGNDSEKERNEDAKASKRFQKCLRRKQMNDHKILAGPFLDHFQSQSFASGDSSLLLLKTRNF